MARRTIIAMAVFFLMATGTFVGYGYFFQKKESSVEWIEAKRGEISEVVSSTGQVVPLKKLGLQFEIQGKIKEIRKRAGEVVEKGEALIALEDQELQAGVLEMTAAQEASQASLDKILSGPNKEEVRIYQTAVENSQIALRDAKTSLKNSQQSLEDVKMEAQNKIDRAYEDALNTLMTNYTLADKALLGTVNSVQEKYFNNNDQLGIKVREKEEAALISLLGQAGSGQKGAKGYLKEITDSKDEEGIDAALIELKLALEKIKEALEVLKEGMADPLYKSLVAVNDRAIIDNERTNVDSSLTSLAISQQTIASQKISNQKNINLSQASLESSQNQVDGAAGDLRASQDKLAQVLAPPSQAEIDLARAQLNQAKASLLRTKEQLSKTRLMAPCKGVISSLDKEEGETVVTTTDRPVLVLICQGEFQIELDVSEVDIAKISLGDRAQIFLDAFKEKEFSGEVLMIEPTETVIQGVVYYKVKVGIDNAPKEIRPGMTANVDIVAQTRKDSLLIPQRALFVKDGKKMVRIIKNGEIKEAVVITGLRSFQGEIEVLSGLKEGDRVITFLKNK